MLKTCAPLTITAPTVVVYHEGEHTAGQAAARHDFRRRPRTSGKRAEGLMLLPKVSS